MVVKNEVVVVLEKNESGDMMMKVKEVVVRKS
jgi:hypothetical protein